MPLLDHFRPPVSKKRSWEGFHGMWPAMMVQQLCKVLPAQYTAEPRVHLGAYYEIDVCAFEEEHFQRRDMSSENGSQVVATAVWAPPEPTMSVDQDPAELYQYEVLIFDQNRDRELVAAIEIASPGNQDRPQHRQSFVAKCATLLQQKVCVSIVDLVTTMNFNLYCDLLELFEEKDAAFAPPPSTYAVTCRSHKLPVHSRFETWAYPLVVGQPLPILPVWLDPDLAVALDLESSYQAACQALRLV